MTPEHIIFIPTIFLLGLLTGILISVRRTGGGTAVLVTLGIALSVFVLNHLTPIPTGVVALHNITGGQPIFDQSPSFDSAEVLARLDAFGAEGRVLYQRFTYTGDLLFPLTVLLFLLAFARFSARQLAHTAIWIRLLAILPIAWFAFDMLENTLVFSLIAAFPDEMPALAAILGPVTAIKFLLLPTSLIAQFVGLFVALVKSTRTRSAV